MVSGPGATLLLPLTLPASWLYGGAIAARGALYRAVPPLRRRLPAPAVVVGNLSVGGTGKTSMVSWLAAWYQARGLRVGILSRGYRRPSGGNRAVVVSAGRGPLVSWAEAGDEPFLLARRHPEAIVISGPDRVRAADAAVRVLGAELLLLDDAFQHWRVLPDLAIVMVDGAVPPWKDRLLPAGRLREPARAASRADFLVEVGETDPAGWSSCGAGHVPRVSARVAERGVRPFAAPAEPFAAAAATRAKRAWLLSGVGNPRAFAASAARLGFELAGHSAHRDHHRFGPGDLAAAVRAARAAGAELLLTTEKDEVRLESLPRGERGGEPSLPIFTLGVRLELAGGVERLESALAGAAARPAGAAP